MSFKDDELDTAKRFLIELGTPVHEFLTLKDFARRDPDPAFDVERLDNNCPDIIAITATGVIGLELTAYSDDDSENRLSTVWRDLQEAAAQLADGFLDLRGFQIHVSPNQDNILRKRDARALAVQVLEFVRSEHTSVPFVADQHRHYSAQMSRQTRKLFARTPLLGQHVSSVTVHFLSTLQDAPPMLYGGFGSSFGTRVQRLSKTIIAKATKLKSAYTRGLNTVWLLIHANGNPRSSRIAPMWHDEIERLIRSPARQCANESGFDRVVLWDGVRGGMVDFMNPELSLAQQM